MVSVLRGIDRTCPNRDPCRRREDDNAWAARYALRSVRKRKFPKYS
jgi:hypothetical protein